MTCERETAPEPTNPGTDGVENRGTALTDPRVRVPGDNRPRCAFCNNVGAQWVYPIADFQGPQYAPGRSATFHGPWHACEKCHSHVETYRWARMRRRTLRRFRAACGPLTERQFQLACRQLNTFWHRFRLAQMGPAYRIDGQS